MSKDLPTAARETFEWIGAYIVDTLCNHHYELARQRHAEGRAHTITAAYVDVLRQFAYSLTKQQKVYQSFVVNLLRAYNKLSRHEYTVSAFENRVLAQFIPQEYYSQFTNADKEKALMQILTTTVSELCVFACSDKTLRSIIDDRDKNTVIILQDQVNTSLERQRSEFYNKFAAQIVRNAAGGGVDHEVYNRLLAEFKEEKKKRIVADKQCDKLTRMVTALDNEVTQLRRENEQIRAEIGRKGPPAAPAPVVASTKLPQKPTDVPVITPVNVDDSESSGSSEDSDDDTALTPSNNSKDKKAALVDEDTGGSFWT